MSSGIVSIGICHGSLPSLIPTTVPDDGIHISRAYLTMLLTQFGRIHNVAKMGWINQRTTRTVTHGFDHGTRMKNQIFKSNNHTWERNIHVCGIKIIPMMNHTRVLPFHHCIRNIHRNRFHCQHPLFRDGMGFTVVSFLGLFIVVLIIIDELEIAFGTRLGQCKLLSCGHSMAYGCRHMDTAQTAGSRIVTATKISSAGTFPSFSDLCNCRIVSLSTGVCFPQAKYRHVCIYVIGLMTENSVRRNTLQL